MNFICLPVSFFSFKSTFSVSLVLPSLHLCKNHKTLDLIMILQHNLTSKMVTQLSNHYSTWCNGITRFKWSNQWEIQQKLSTDPIHGPPVWSKKADLLCISGMQRRLIHYGEYRVIFFFSSAINLSTEFSHFSDLEHILSIISLNFPYKTYKGRYWRRTFGC